MGKYRPATDTKGVRAMPKRKRKKSWFQSLKKKQRKHVRWALGGLRLTLVNFEQSREQQARQKAEHPENPEPCWECWEIERDLKEKGFI